MSVWYRIFASLDVVPAQPEIESVAVGLDASTRIAWSGETGGWYQAEIDLGGTRLVLERWLAEEEGIRSELNTWAGYLETFEDNPAHEALMERAIQARQLFTLERPEEQDQSALPERLCETLARRLAVITGGFYQVDERGFFSAEGELLIAER